jgi:hypothetical protein
VETPRKFITAKLSIRKPGSSSVLIICNKIYVVFPQTKLLYILSPCKHTKNLLFIIAFFIILLIQLKFCYTIIAVIFRMVSWTTKTKSIILNTKSYINNWHKLALYFRIFHRLNQFLMFTFKNCKKILQFVMCNDFPSFLTCFFIIFASFTPGEQPYFEISEMTTHTPCARDFRIC